jgi:hypothetical protein
MTDDDIIIEDDDPQPFTVPLPPPPFPGSRDKFLYVRSRGGEAGDKEHEDLMLRRVPRETAMRFRGSAGGRGLTHAQYLTALASLHESMRTLADDGDEGVRAELERLGLTTVTV